MSPASHSPPLAEHFSRLGRPELSLTAQIVQNTSRSNFTIKLHLPHACKMCTGNKLAVWPGCMSSLPGHWDGRIQQNTTRARLQDFSNCRDTVPFGKICCAMSLVTGSGQGQNDRTNMPPSILPGIVHQLRASRRPCLPADIDLRLFDVRKSYSPPPTAAQL